MATMFYDVAALLIFAACTLPYSLILVTLLVLALLVCFAVDRIRWKAWQRRAEAVALARRADEQYAATLRGELYGTYGRYMPAREFLPVVVVGSVSTTALARSCRCSRVCGAGR